MQVETFEVQEVAAEPLEACEEALTLIEELGLEGQKSLTCKHEASDSDARFPYREMLAEEVRIYGILCPSKVKLEEYKASPIPLRVLQVAAHCMSLNPELQLFVWDKRSAEIKDPVLVAETRGNSWDAGFKRFILARWGEELEHISVLFKRAVDEKRPKVITQCRRQLASVEAASDAEILEW